MSAPGTPSGSSLFGGLQLKSTPTQKADASRAAVSSSPAGAPSTATSAFAFIRQSAQTTDSSTVTSSPAAPSSTPAAAATQSPRQSVFSFIASPSASASSTPRTSDDASLRRTDGPHESAATATLRASGGSASGAKKKAKSRRLVRPGHERDSTDGDGAHVSSEDVAEDDAVEAAPVASEVAASTETPIRPHAAAESPGLAASERTSAHRDVTVRATAAQSRDAVPSAAPPQSPAPGERGVGDGVNHSIPTSRGASLTSSVSSLVDSAVTSAPAVGSSTVTPALTAAESVVHRAVRDQRPPLSREGSRSDVTEEGVKTAVTPRGADTQTAEPADAPVPVRAVDPAPVASSNVESLERELSELDSRLACAAKAREAASKAAQGVAGRILARERRLAELFLTLGECRREQEEAVAREDYDAADALSSRLRAVQDEIASSYGGASSNAAASVAEELRVAVETESRASEAEIEAIKERTAVLEGIRRERAAALDALQRRATIRLAERRKRIAADKDRAARELAHVDLDLSHVVASIQRVRSEVDEGTAAQKSEVARLERERARVGAEIDALMIRLDALRSAVRTLDAAIVKEKAKMDEVSLSYGGEQSRLEADRLRLVGARNSAARKLEALTAEEAMLDRSPEGLGAEIASEEKALKEIDQRMTTDRRHLADISGSKAEIFEWLSRSLAGENTLALLAEGPGVEADDVKRLRAEVDERSKEVASLTAVLIRHQEEASTVKKTIAEASTRLPELEEEKRLAVAGYNFKEAGRVAALIKDISAANASAVARVAALESDLATTRARLSEAKGRVDSARARLYDLEKSNDLAELERWKGVFLGLVDRLKRVRLQQRSARDTHPPQSPAAKGGRSGSMSESRGVLSCEIDACRFRIMGLCAKHDLEPDIDLDADRTPDCSARGSAETQNIFEFPTHSPQPTQTVAPTPVSVLDLLGENGAVDGTDAERGDLPAVTAEAQPWQAEMEKLEEELKAAISAEDYDTAATLHERIQALRDTTARD